jgi:hypothetical protein
LEEKLKILRDSVSTDFKVVALQLRELESVIRDQKKDSSKVEKMLRKQKESNGSVSKEQL